MVTSHIPSQLNMVSGLSSQKCRTKAIKIKKNGSKFLGHSGPRRHQLPNLHGGKGDSGVPAAREQQAPQVHAGRRLGC